MTTKLSSILGLRHVALSVVELEACVEFYKSLGFTIDWHPDANNVYLTSGTDNLALHKGQAAIGHQKLDHIGFMLKEEQDVDDWFEFLKAKSVNIVAAPKTHRDGSRSFYCKDPDGTIIQMIHYSKIG